MYQFFKTEMAQLLFYVNQVEVGDFNCYTTILFYFFRLQMFYQLENYLKLLLVQDHFQFHYQKFLKTSCFIIELKKFTD